MVKGEKRMTKRPPIEELLELYNQYDSRREAVVGITEKYEVRESTAYEWVKQYVSGISSSVRDNVDEQTEDFFEMVDSLLEEDMDRRYRSADITIPVDSGGILIVCMSDLHVGNRYTNMEMLKNDVKDISETPGVYAFIVGDLLDVAGVKSTPHKNLSLDQVMPFKKAKEFVKKMYEVFGDKVLATTSGCHGAWSYNDTGEYYEEEFVQLTDTKVFLEHGGTLAIQLGDQTYRIFMSHKVRGNSKLNPTRGLFRLHEQGLDFDVGIGAHHHEQAALTLPRRGKLITCIKCGTYKLLDNFANKVGFVQQKMTIPGFYISADQHEVIPFIDWRQGLQYLR
jgi:hypothetical protein